MRKLQKAILLTLAALSVMVVVAILIVSPLTKYYIEKNDLNLTGREIEMKSAYANIFTGYVRLNDLVIYEAGNRTVFLEAKSLSVNVELWGLLFSDYELSEAKLIQPRGRVVQKGTDFNFMDIVQKFTTKDSTVKRGEPVRFSMHGIEVVNGEFHYEAEQTDVKYFIKNVNILSAGFSHDVDTMPFSFDFNSGIGTGQIRGDWTINTRNLDYKLDILIAGLNLDIINQYLRELTNYGSFAAVLDAEMHSSGNFGNIRALTTKGQFSISDFHFGKNPDEEYASFESLTIGIIEMNPEELIYHYDSVALVKPFFRYELYDQLDNVQTMFGADGANVATASAGQFNLVIEIAKLVEKLSRNFFRSNYRIGRVAIYDGNFEFADYSLSEKFLISLSPFNARADSLDKTRSRVEARFDSGIVPFGKMAVNLSVNPRDSSFFDLDYRFSEMPLSMFNPYAVTYTSFPLDRGVMEISGRWNVDDGNISSQNHIIMLDPRVAKKVKTKDNKWIPMPLAMAFLREHGNVIDYEIPIKGRMNDPKFKIKDVLFDLLKNIFVNPVTTPYRMEVKKAEQQLEKSLSLSWDIRECSLTNNQEKFIGKMAGFLKDNPEARIIIAPMLFEAKEKEFILLFEAKKQYLLAKGKLNENDFSENDSVRIARMSVKDPDFEKYLNEMAKDLTLFTAQHKAATFIPAERVNAIFDQINAKRQSTFTAGFADKNVADRVSFSKAKNIIPFNGYSFYDISYTGDFPDYLREAANQMTAFDKENPREKYRAKRITNTKAQ